MAGSSLSASQKNRAASSGSPGPVSSSSVSPVYSPRDVAVIENLKLQFAHDLVAVVSDKVAVSERGLYPREDSNL